MPQQRDLAAEQAAGRRLSQEPGSQFKGQNFADPIVKKSYFEAINQEVYGVPNPDFGEGGTSFTPSPVNQPAQTSISPPTGAPPTGGGFVTEEQFGVGGAEAAYKRARDQFSKLSLGTGAYQETAKKTYEQAYPEIESFTRQEGEKREELGNMRNELEMQYAKAGIVDPQIKNALIEKRMNEVRKDIFSIETLKRQRGLTIQDLTNKAMTAYGLSVDAAQSAATMANEDYLIAFDKYARALKTQEDDRDRLFDLAFDPTTLQGGVAPEALFKFNPELRSAWERMSDVERPAYLESLKPTGPSGPTTTEPTALQAGDQTFQEFIKEKEEGLQMSIANPEQYKPEYDEIIASINSQLGGGVVEGKQEGLDFLEQAFKDSPGATYEEFWLLARTTAIDLSIDDVKAFLRSKGLFPAKRPSTTTTTGDSSSEMTTEEFIEYLRTGNLPARLQ